MINIKSYENFEDRYDYQRIIRILRKSHGWGMGVLSSIDDFEANDEYFKTPIDENDYVEQFHIYLSDLENNRLKGTLNTDSKLRVGHWNKGVQVAKPINIWNSRM